MKNRSSAFTLIELLSVIAVIGILAAILIPVASSVRHNAQASEAVSNIRQIGTAALLYSNENYGKVPGLGNDSTTNGMGVAGALYPYLEARVSNDWPTWPQLMGAYRSISDPRLPDELLRGGWKWVGFNGIFADYPVADSSGVKPDKEEERLLRFANPGKVIYAATGDGNLKVEHVGDASQLPLPASPREGFYFAHDEAVPTVFLDGHAEMLSFPIDPRLLDPSYQESN